MAGTIRHKSHDGWNIKVPVLNGVQVDIGDLLFLSAAGNATPASGMASFTGNPSKAAFHESFLGVSDSATTGNETIETFISVSVQGHFDYPVDALGGASIVGSYVGAEETAGVLEDQELQIVANIGDSIGVLVAPAAIGDTRLHCRLTSSVILGGVQEVI